MLNDVLIKKYNELKANTRFHSLSFVAKYNDVVYYTKNGTRLEERDFPSYGSVGATDIVAKKVLTRFPDTNVVAFVFSDSIRHASAKGGIPLMLDDFSEMFGGKVEAVNRDEHLILSALRKKRAVLVTNYYAVVRARSVDEAVSMCRIIEKNAFILTKVKAFVPIKQWVSSLENFVFTNFYSKRNQERQWASETGASAPITPDIAIEPNDKRNDIMYLATEIFNSNATQGTWGNVAVRINDSELYCTPKGVGYNLLSPQAMVKLDYRTNTRLSGGVPTSEKGIHCRIMREYKDAYASIHAHPTFASIFSARNATLTVSEQNRAVLGDKIYCSPHALPMTKKLTNNTVDALNGSKAVFMGNHGVTVYGTSAEDALNVLYTLEAECERQIMEENLL